MSSILRSIVAIVIGFVVIAALAIGTAVGLTAAGVFPSAIEPITNPGLLLLETVYVAVYAIFGCWLAAFLAPNRPMRHALILGALGLVLNLVMAPTTWGVRPAWSVVLNLALVMPYAWLGGRLRERQLERSGAQLAHS